MKTRYRGGKLVLIGSLLFLLVVIPTAQAAGSSPAGSNWYSTSGRPENQANTPTPLILTETQNKYPLGLNLSLLEDPTGELTIEEVSSPVYEGRFTPSPVDVPNYGYTESVYWVRFTLDNQTRFTSEWLLEDDFANTQYIDLYAPLPDGEGFEVTQTGALRPISTRDVLYPNIVFRLNVTPQSQVTYYMRFESGASMTIPLTLWTNSAFFTESTESLILHWLLFGGLVAILIYHIFLLISLKEVTYLYFVILIVGIVAMLLEYLGYMSLYFIPALYKYKPLFLPVFIGVLYVGIIAFSDTFLDLKTRLPELHKVNLGLLAGWGVLLLLVPFVSYLTIARLMTPWQLFCIAVTWVIGVVAWRKGVRPVGFFMVAWLGMAASMFLLVLVRLAIIPSTYFNENIFQLGFLVMVVSWSIALADRINLLKAETENANRDLQKSEYRLSQILEGFPLGVVVYGQDQKPHYLNKRAIEILSNPKHGITPSVEAGRTLAQTMEYYPFKDAKTGEKFPLEKMPVFKALRGEPASLDNLVMDFGDTVIPLEVWASPVRDDTGIVETAIGVFQDVTDRKHAEAELAEYRKSLEQLVEKRTAELNEVNDRLRMRLEWVSAINRLQQSITDTTSLGKVYEELLGWILELFQAELAFIVRWDDPREHLDIYSTSSEDCEIPDNSLMDATFHKDSALRQQFKTGKTITWIADQSSLPMGLLEDWFRELGIRRLIMVPMIVGQSSFGVLGIAEAELAVDPFTAQAGLVERIAFDLASLAEGAILSEQQIALVALEERNRLARDLHDSVTQVLFTATLLTEILPQIWRRDPQQGMETLEKLRLLTRGALAEMRTMLIELRPSSVVNTPLSQLLAQLTEAITYRSGLPFQLVIENIPLLPEEAQMNFYRIAQEALNNVVKHAQALHVVVTLSEVQLLEGENGEAGRSVKLVIQDDGVGFSTGSEKAGHLGLGIMRERAAAIGASLSVDSELGHGTIVSLIWESEPGFEEAS